MKRLSRIFVALAINALTGVLMLSAEEPVAQGNICVAPVPDEASAHDSETGNRRGYVSYEFTVRIDKGKWVKIPTDKPLGIKSIDLTKKHLLSIRDGDRLIESFWFTFKGRGGSDLCLSYKSWYQTWLLEPPLNRPWCQCKDKD